MRYNMEDNTMEENNNNTSNLSKVLSTIAVVRKILIDEEKLKEIDKNFPKALISRYMSGLGNDIYGTAGSTELMAYIMFSRIAMEYMHDTASAEEVITKINKIMNDMGLMDIIHEFDMKDLMKDPLHITE